MKLLDINILAPAFLVFPHEIAWRTVDNVKSEAWRRDTIARNTIGDVQSTIRGQHFSYNREIAQNTVGNANVSFGDGIARISMKLREIPLAT